MEKKTMTIHRALAELKLIDARIEKQIAELVPAGIFQKGKLVNGFLTEVDFTTNAQSKFDSVTDLIERKTAIKSAIVAANGVTKVKVGEKEMTVSDAITFKGIVKHKRMLVTQLRRGHQSALSALNQNNAVVEQNLQKLLEFTFSKESTKVEKGDLDAVSKPFLESNQFHLADPVNALTKADKIEAEVSAFEVEIDAALSEINAVTFIEV